MSTRASGTGRLTSSGGVDGTGGREFGEGRRAETSPSVILGVDALGELWNSYAPVA